MNITYRKLLPEESKMYRNIRLESLQRFPEAFSADYQEALNTQKLRIESDIEDQTQDKFVMGAFADQELIGICVFVKNENNAGSIYQMYVKKEFQGKNIGLQLIKAVIHEADERFGDLEIVLEVASGNDKAYFLYKKAGFKEIGNKTEGNIHSFTMKYP